MRIAYKTKQQAKSVNLGRSSIYHIHWGFTCRGRVDVDSGHLPAARVGNRYYPLYLLPAVRYGATLRIARYKRHRFHMLNIAHRGKLGHASGLAS